MKIAGLDLSLSSPGCVKFNLDIDLNIIESEFLGFNSKTKKDYGVNIINTKILDFKDEIERNITISDFIYEFAKDCEYISFEGYSYGSPGRLAQLGEFAGIIKSKLYPLGTKIRLYDPNSVKKNATGFGNADKFDMHEAFLKSENKIDLAGLPPCDEKHRKTGVSPYSDICDAFWLAEMLLLEIKVRKGIVNLKDENEERISIFNRVTKSNPVNLLDTPFTESRK